MSPSQVDAHLQATLPAAEWARLRGAHAVEKADVWRLLKAL